LSNRVGKSVLPIYDRTVENRPTIGQLPIIYYHYEIFHELLLI